MDEMVVIVVDSLDLPRPSPTPSIIHSPSIGWGYKDDGEGGGGGGETEFIYWSCGGGGLKKMMIIVHTEFKFATKCGLSTILDR